MSGVFRLSEGASLGLHGMGILALLKRRASAAEMANELQVSQAHLAKVFQKLVHADLVLSTRGASGGFELARCADSITLLEIYRAIEGEATECSNCVLGLSECPFNQCLFGQIPSEVNQRFEKQLAAYRLSDFIGQTCEMASQE